MFACACCWLSTEGRARIAFSRRRRVRGGASAAHQRILDAEKCADAIVCAPRAVAWLTFACVLASAAISSQRCACSSARGMSTDRRRRVKTSAVTACVVVVVVVVVVVIVVVVVVIIVAVDTLIHVAHLCTIRRDHVRASAWLLPPGASPDLYVIGFQEIVDLTTGNVCVCAVLLLFALLLLLLLLCFTPTAPPTAPQTADGRSDELAAVGAAHQRRHHEAHCTEIRARAFWRVYRPHFLRCVDACRRRRRPSSSSLSSSSSSQLKTRQLVGVLLMVRDSIACDGCSAPYTHTRSRAGVCARGARLRSAPARRRARQARLRRLHCQQGCGCARRRCRALCARSTDRYIGRRGAHKSARACDDGVSTTGAVAVRLNLYDTSLCFVCAHLAAGQSNVVRRRSRCTLVASVCDAVAHLLASSSLSPLALSLAGRAQQQLA